MTETGLARRATSDVDLAQLSFEELELLAETSQVGDTHTKIDDAEKRRLVGVPMIVTDLSFKDDGNFGDGRYVVVRARLKSNEGIVFSGGGAGFYRQLEDAVERGIRLPMLVAGGLRESKYTYKDPQTGRETPATTYYLSGGKGIEDLQGLGAKR